MHLFGPAARGFVERTYGPLGPALAFRKQAHLQENRHRGCGKTDAHSGIATGTETPIQRRPDIVEIRKMS